MTGPLILPSRPRDAPMYNRIDGKIERVDKPGPERYCMLLHYWHTDHDIDHWERSRKTFTDMRQAEHVVTEIVTEIRKRLEDGNS